MNDHDTYGSSFREAMKRSLEKPATFRRTNVRQAPEFPLIQRVILALIVIFISVTVAAQVAIRLGR